MTSPSPSTLWRDRSFLFLWFGQSISEVGTAVTTIVLPLLAISLLNAGPGELGVLKAMSWAAVLVAAVPAGVYVDRVSKRRLMLVCDVARALVLASVPLFAWFGWLSIVWLCAAAFVVGVLSVTFGIAYHSYFPTFVRRDQLADANAKIQTTDSFARVSGPGIGAFLAGAIGVAASLVVDIVSYLASAVSLLFTPKDLPRTNTADQRPRWRDSVKEGFTLLVANPPLARTALTTIGSMLALSMMNAVFLYHLVVEVKLSTAVVGLVFLVGEGGGLLAAVFASRIMRLVGSARIMWLVVFLSPAGYLVVAAPGLPAVFATAYLLLTSWRFVLFDIAQYSYRQSACPLEKLGAVTASIRFCIGAAGVVGALAGGWLGDLLGGRGSMLVATTIMCVMALPVLFSSIRHTREIEDLPRISAPHEKITAEQ
ncbi:MFS transporter [Lentzea sp. NPDC004789]